MKQSVFIGGAHRGGRTITEEAVKALPEQQVFDRVIIADPKDTRAKELADVWQANGIRADGIEEPCEKAIKRVDANSIMLAIDTIAPMSKILESDARPAQWQMLCRGLGENGPVLGMSGSIHEGVSENRSSSINLIREMGSFIRPQSSMEIRQNPLNADFLHTMRRRVSKHSAQRLAVLTREPQDIPGGPLNFFWGPTHYPLMIQEKPARARWRELKDQVLSVELPPYLKNVPAYAMAIVGKKNVDFFVIEESRGRRSVRFHMPLAQALPQPGEDFMAAAMVGIGAAVASMLTAAVVTD